MTNLSKEFCESLREARKAKGISQSALAQEVGCKQSALSMFEYGDGTKLNDEVVKRLCEKFGLEVPKSGDASSGTSNAFATTSVNDKGFCPNPHCPSNKRYMVGEREYARPERSECDPVGGRYCAICGEVLEKRCPNCGARLHDGGVCSFCGQAYVAM